MNLYRFLLERVAGVTAVALAAVLSACGGGGGTDPAAADTPLLKVAATPVPAHSPITGAVFTSDLGCLTVNKNLYDLKTDVYLNGGPLNVTGNGMLSAGLPQNTSFYVQVTSPQGALLGTSVGNGAPLSETPVHTDSTGKVIGCPQLWAIVHNPDDNSPGYKTTPNNGGEYMVWISLSSDFAKSSTVTDNFKVKEGQDGVGGIQSNGAITVRKWYDANADGQWDSGESELTGWRVDLTGFTPQFTPWDFISPSLLTMVAGEFRPTQTNWYPTGSMVLLDPLAGPTLFNVQGSDPTYLNHAPVTIANLDATAVVSFGNVCLGAGGGKTLGFWSNKNGQALITDPVGSNTLKLGIKTLLVALNLVKGTDPQLYVYDPTTYADLRNWLLNANAVNMAYMLSAQLAAMQLNVQTGQVSGTALVYAPGVISANFAGFITINDLMAEANTSLGANPVTRAGYSPRAYQELIKNALDNANNNLNFVQAAACPFSFPTWVPPVTMAPGTP